MKPRQRHLGFRIHVTSQLCLLGVALLFNHLAKFNESARFLESFRPSLQRMFYANEREELAKTLFTLHQATRGSVVAMTSDGGVLADFGVKPHATRLQILKLGLTPEKTDATILFYSHWFAFERLHIVSWLALSLVLFGVLHLLLSEQSRRKDLELKSAKSSAIAQTVASFAHDVRKPFALISLLLRTLPKTNSAAEAKALSMQALPEIQRSARTVESMIADVLDLTRGNLTPNLTRTEISVNEILQRSLRTVLQTEEERDCTITSDIRALQMLKVDVARIERVISNICWNAFQAMKTGGSLILKAYDFESHGQPMISLTIGNTGSFIEPQSLPFLFDAFYTQGKSDGTGLGLAIAKMWVERHGGEIFCRSLKDQDYPTGLVEFVLSLPAGESNPSPESPKIASNARDYSKAFPGLWTTEDSLPLAKDPTATQHLRVAFVDDSLVMRITWQRALKDLAELSVFRSPEEFQNSILQFDVVVTDLRFDGHKQDGRTLAKWTREHMPGAKVLLCSAAPEAALSNDGRETPLFDGVIPKDEIPTVERLVQTKLGSIDDPR